MRHDAGLRKPSLSGGFFIWGYLPLRRALGIGKISSREHAEALECAILPTSAALEGKETGAERARRWRKLKDHIDLEFIHIGQLKKHQLSVQGMEALTAQLPKMNTQFSDMDERLKDTNRKINDQTVQSISILGIFAGVVFAFSGGFSMLSSTLSNIHLISGEQTLFFFSTTLGIGCILYDVVFALMVFIGRYCDKEPRNIWGFTKVLNGMVFTAITILMIIYCLCYNGDIRLIPCR